MPRLVWEHLIALLAGWFVAASVLRLLAVIAAAPGLRWLIETIRAAGFPLHFVFALVTGYVPVVLFAFVIGLPVFKSVRGHRGWLLLAAVLPWTGHLVYWYSLFCLDTDVSCFGGAPFDTILTMLDVPLGFALAALATRPARPQSAQASAASQLR